MTVTGVTLEVGAAVDGAGRPVTTAAGGKKAGARPWSLRLPIRGAGSFRVEYAGRRLRVFRGSGGLAVQVRP